MSDKPKILLVDDVEENLVALEGLLRRHDVEIVSAHSGSQALEHVLVQEFSLALIDVQMPEMDGFELAELMRGSQRSKYIPIIFVTAGAHDAQRVFRGYETGAVDFLFKPVDPHMLRQKVETFVQLDLQKRQLAEQYRLLQQSEVQLKDAVQAREDVLAVVSHDIRNFLHSIKTSSYLLSDRAEALSPEVKIKVHKRIQTTVDLMSRVITDLMDMANIRAGRIAVSLQAEVVNRIVAEALAVHEPIAQEKGIHIGATLPPESIVVSCDRERILQVFSNLLGNALKFCQRGGEVRITCEVHAKEYRIAIRDNGPGIPPEDMPNVFKPYWSGPENREKGTGLGLYITQRIIEAHGTKITIESQVGVGTTVTFALPLVEK